MLHEEIANRHMEMADRYGDNRLSSALINKSADIAHRRVEGQGLRGGSLGYANQIGSDTRGLNYLVNFPSIGLRDQNYVDSYTDFAEGTENMNGAGFTYAHGRGLRGDGLKGGSLGMLLASAASLAGKGLRGSGRFVKGSAEAKAYMASLRAKRTKK